MTTIYDIAKKCSCSPSTVSKVINNYPSIPEKTKQKVLKTMREMDFIPNQTASTLSKGKSNNVGILAFLGLSISPLRHGLFSEILESFQRKMNEKNYDLLFVSNNVGNNKGTLYENCMARGVDGVLLFGDMNAKEMQEIINSDIPSIGFDYVGEHMSGVYSNNYDLMYELTTHLIKLGHRRIVFVCGDDSEITSSRIEAFKNAMSDNDIPIYSDYLIRTHYLNSEELISEVKKLFSSNSEKPTAIMCPDDLTAVKLIQYCHKMGIKCPEDISITGFDGIEMGRLITPTLTTARQDSKAIGEKLAEKLIDLMTNKKTSRELIRIPGSIVVGESTCSLKETNKESSYSLENKTYVREGS
ncbi:MAG TPA: LacI family transcriptional regulator [Firmicutes bacterium]|nr:LacI family transcriptional regulator [Bacillota bacterium]